MTNEQGGIKQLSDMCGEECRWFLVGLTNGHMTHRDGCHGSIKGVRQALYLHQALHLRESPDAWYAVYIGKVTPNAEGVNHEAIDICNEMLDARLRQT